jgi:hypothetical protein
MLGTEHSTVHARSGLASAVCAARKHTTAHLPLPRDGIKEGPPGVVQNQPGTAEPQPATRASPLHLQDGRSVTILPVLVRVPDRPRENTLAPCWTLKAALNPTPHGRWDGTGSPSTTGVAWTWTRVGVPQATARSLCRSGATHLLMKSAEATDITTTEAEKGKTGGEKVLTPTSVSLLRRMSLQVRSILYIESRNVAWQLSLRSDRFDVRQRLSAS